jgi:hypothetical protein
MRVAVIGGPRTGKTTYATQLAKELGVYLASTGKRTLDPLLSTDNFMTVGWDNVPARVIAALEDKEDFVLEGTQAARVLRRWYGLDLDGPRLDRVVYFDRPWVQRNGGQEAMAKGVATVFRDVEPYLRELGVPLIRAIPRLGIVELEER